MSRQSSLIHEATSIIQSLCTSDVSSSVNERLKSVSPILLSPAKRAWYVSRTPWVFDSNIS